MAPTKSRVKVFLRSRPSDNFANDMIEYGSDNKTVNIYNKRNALQGYVNNQINDWSFKVDGIMHNVSQDAVYDQVVKDITVKTLDGYNGNLKRYTKEIGLYWEQTFQKKFNLQFYISLYLNWIFF